mmetsp:Transcript_1849/g.2658  ORF Transcript_1849/g.2658 Transcript_1849/m.2658 type:complete len:244 (+) Transcript_1849:70-801(+)|eukprot:CAMPEP_0201545858 /NCGR_PEP_ID=MMETSP0173_2-20130828/2278_1 /ASSEMBLY_ACC=CAM_ASM_000268 /TAXON_ID=218659 /ORGANISM="Vexillifera sp., Strain DIVA3 564/2" /LENGTH=243 /DNA_ID=CAMNT_0047954385 /DNA_START=52 /DNA_END=783 /DNA_ORIENTATION=+
MSQSDLSLPSLDDISSQNQPEQESGDEQVITITVGDDPDISGVLEDVEMNGAEQETNTGTPSKANKSSTSSPSLSMSSMASIALSPTNIGSVVTETVSRWREKPLESVRPWGEFFDRQRLGVPRPTEIRQRTSQNLAYFQTNYLILFFVLAIYSVLTSPGLLLIAILMCGLSFYLLYWRQDDIMIGSWKVTAHQKVLMVLVMSLVLCVFTSAAKTLLWIVAIAVVFVMGHALFWSPPEEELFV